MVTSNFWKRMGPNQGVQRVLPQRGVSNLPRDMARKARPSGKRLSKNMKTYWETRRNRTDAIGKRI